MRNFSKKDRGTEVVSYLVTIFYTHIVNKFGNLLKMKIDDFLYIK